MRVEAHVNGQKAGAWTLERVGLFVLEADVPDAPEYSWKSMPPPFGRARRTTANSAST